MLKINEPRHIQKKLYIFPNLDNSRSIFAVSGLVIVLSLFISTFQIATIFTETDMIVQSKRILIGNLVYVLISTFTTWWLVEQIRSYIEKFRYAGMIFVVLCITICVNVILTILKYYTIKTLWFEEEYLLSKLLVEIVAKVLLAIFLVSAIVYLYEQYCRLKEHVDTNLKTQLLQLQSRLHPSFFFNSLNTLHYLIKTDSNDAGFMVEKISSFYKHSLQESRLIALAEEIEVCSLYVDIEYLRLRKRIEVNWNNNLDKNLIHVEDVSIPSMTIQNIIEMLVNFQAENTKDDITLNCSVEYAHGHIHIKVLAHNVISYNFDELYQQSVSKLFDNGRRLQQDFGDKADIKMENIRDKYVMVVVNYPFIIF